MAALLPLTSVGKITCSKWEFFSPSAENFLKNTTPKLAADSKTVLQWYREQKEENCTVGCEESRRDYEQGIGS